MKNIKILAQQFKIDNIWWKTPSAAMRSDCSSEKCECGDDDISPLLAQHLCDIWTKKFLFYVYSTGTGNANT